MSEPSVKELQARVEELNRQLNRSNATLKAVKSGRGKKKKQTHRKKGFDATKVKSKKGAPGVRPRKKKSQVPGSKPKREATWKPPSIFAQTEQIDDMREKEATALKKKIFEHLKAHINISHTATATTIDKMVEEQLAKSESVSSIFLVNIGWIVDQYLQWTRLLPRVKPFYAVKSNPDINILRTLKMLGAGFDCASQAELAAVKTLGQLSDDIIFANPCKGKSHIAFAKASQVPMMTFDNADEVDKIMHIYPAAKLVLRILPDDKFSLMPFGKKFGASWEESKVLLDKCKAAKACVIGVSFHVGSGCFNTEGYENALRLARDVFDYAKSIGHEMTLLDIGGGFPGDNTAELTFPEIAACIGPALDKLFPKESGVRIIGEPGRYFCSGSSTLAVVINAKKRKAMMKPPTITVDDADEHDEHPTDEHPHEEQRDEDEDDYEDGYASPLRSASSAPDLLADLDKELNRVEMRSSTAHDGDSASADSDYEDLVVRNPAAVVSDQFEFLYYCSDGVYGSFNNIIFDHAHPKPVILDVAWTADEKKNSLLLYKSRLFGPTCDSIDVICDSVELPELNIGDWLLFPNMGAYTVAAASSFNGFAPPNSTYIMSYDDDEEVKK